MRYYSETTGSTYIKGLHKEMPDDAIEIPDELFESVIASAQPGKVRLHKDGLPYLADPAPPTNEEVSSAERIWRDAEIARVQWLRERHRDEVDMGLATTIKSAEFNELLTYIQKLRDWPESKDFPKQVKRPAVPTWISDQVQ
ncbi:phage tail assembly chaperone [Pseudomonas sp. S5D5]|uniref:phage tail assembly chaperone n=1 Tax=Pseudomonas sp. S5D5 TaxID=2083056 RepID=UPI000D0F5D88|nr:phage tail assembly chaperone [Pseudomonas sp. S5D5]